MPGGKNKKTISLGEFLGPEAEQASSLPTAPTGRKKEDSLKAGGHGFARRDYAAEEDVAGEGEADFVEDWRGAGPSLSEQQREPASEQTQESSQEEAWDFRRVPREPTAAEAGRTGMKWGDMEVDTPEENDVDTGDALAKFRGAGEREEEEDEADKFARLRFGGPKTQTTEPREDEGDKFAKLRFGGTETQTTEPPKQDWGDIRNRPPADSQPSRDQPGDDEKFANIRKQAPVNHDADDDRFSSIRRDTPPSARSSRDESDERFAQLRAGPSSETSNKSVYRVGQQRRAPPAQSASPADDGEAFAKFRGLKERGSDETPPEDSKFSRSMLSRRKEFRESPSSSEMARTDAAADGGNTQSRWSSTSDRPSGGFRFGGGRSEADSGESRRFGGFSKEQEGRRGFGGFGKEQEGRCGFGGFGKEQEGSRAFGGFGRDEGKGSRGFSGVSRPDDNPAFKREERRDSGDGQSPTGLSAFANKRGEPRGTAESPAFGSFNRGKSRDAPAAFQRGFDEGRRNSPFGGTSDQDSARASSRPYSRDSPFSRMGKEEGAFGRSRQDNVPTAFSSMNARRDKEMKQEPKEQPESASNGDIHTTLDTSKFAPPERPTTVPPYEEIQRAATVDEQHAKKTARKYIDSILDDFLVNMSMNALDEALDALIEKIPMDYRYLMVEATLRRLRLAEIGRETRQIQSLLHHLLDNDKTIRKPQFWKGFGTYLSQAGLTEEEEKRLAGVLQEYISKGKKIGLQTLSLTEESHKQANDWLKEHLEEAAQKKQDTDDTAQKNKATNYSLQDIEEKCRPVLKQGVKGKELMQQLQNTFDSISASSANVAMGLMRTILEEVHSKGKLSVRADWCSDEEYGAALSHFCNQSVECGTSALFSLQEFFHDYSHIKKKGLAEGSFLRLYREDAIPEDSFLAWKDDTSRKIPGKRDAIFATTKFFLYLDQLKHPEEEESD